MLKTIGFIFSFLFYKKVVDYLRDQINHIIRGSQDLRAEARSYREIDYNLHK